MPGITDFKSQFKKGFARPNLFRVAISEIVASKQAKYQMSCFQAQIPGYNIATTDKDIGKRSVAYQKIFSDIILGFYVDEDLSELKFWQQWMDRIVRPDPSRHNYYDNYIGTIQVTQLNRSGHDVATWTLHDAYPKQVDPIQLDYGTNDAVMTCNTTITYRYFTVDWHAVLEIDSVTKETKYTHNVNSAMMEINPMEEIHKEAWKYRDDIPGFNKADWPDWDSLSFAQQAKILDEYRDMTASKTGGAFNMVVDQEEF